MRAPMSPEGGGHVGFAAPTYGSVETSPVTPQSEPSMSPRTSWRVVGAAAAGLMVLVSASLVVQFTATSTTPAVDAPSTAEMGMREKLARNEPSVASFGQTTQSFSELKIKVSNEYTKTHGYMGQGYPWLSEGHLIEPHKLSTLTLWEAKDKPFDKFSWRIEQVTNTMGGSAKTIIENSTTSETLEVMLATPGNYIVRVTSFSGAGNTTEVGMILCRYVRRNIRSLTDDDRNAFFDAFLTIMKTPSQDGMSLYGSKYRTLTSFVEMHAQLAGNKLCDHMHDGLGFLTQHTALTMDLEAALQVVDPSVTVPYWDFTYDINDADSTDAAAVQVFIWNMDIWSASWFGNASGSMHTVQHGRWAYQTIDMAGNSTVQNPYGYLRAPWNMNNSPYLTRVHNFCGYPLLLQKNWPDCAMHHSWALSKDYTNLYDFLWHAPYAPHATIHSNIGGYTNCGNITERLKASGVQIPDHDLSTAVGKMVTDAVIFVKSMWRAGFAETPGYCTSDTPVEECHMVCDSRVNNMSFVLSLVEEHPKWVGDWVEDMPEKFWPAVARVLCTTPWTPGEHLEAASPADVSFWPVHPTLERLTQYKRLARDFKSTSWDNPSGRTKVCIYGDTDCKGHNAQDLTSFQVTHTNDKSEFVEEYLTNVELFQVMNPNEYHLNYIYDNFKWDHCSSKYSFPVLPWGNTTLVIDDSPVADKGP